MSEANGAGRWPEGYRAALCVSVDVDGRYGETNARTPDPFWINQTAYDPTGLGRLLEIFADADVAATFCWVGRVAEERPDLVERAVAAGHEIACHSWDHRAYVDLDRDAQRADVEQTRAALTRIAGVAPVGHKTPGWRYDAQTFGVLRELGFAWAMDEPGGDLPYVHPPDPPESSGGADPSSPALIHLPPSWLFDDYPFFVDRLLTPAQTFDFWREDLDQLRAEGKLMCLTLHPFVAGRPGPSRAVVRLLDHAIEAGDIWITRADRLAAWWRERHANDTVGG